MAILHIMTRYLVHAPQRKSKPAKRVRWTTALSLTAMLTACSGGPTAREVASVSGTSRVKILPSKDLPTPQVSDYFANIRPYRIGPFDRLMIDVFGIDALSKVEVQTDASGRISFPLAGEIEAAGKTPTELARALATRLRASYIRDPQVTVNLKETVSQVVTVDGEVKEPGLYPVVGQMTLMRAIATAKGTTDLAKLSNVIVFRTVNGQRYAALYNLRAIRQGAYDDPEIYPNDIVVVSDSQARRIFRDALGILPALTYVVVALLNN